MDFGDGSTAEKFAKNLIANSYELLTKVMV